MPRPPHPLEVKQEDGTVRVYNAHPFDNGRKKVWALWVYKKYREIVDLEREEDGLSDEEYHSRLNYLRQMHFKGEFSFLSERGAIALGTPDGSVEITRILFDLPTTDDALELMVRSNGEADKLIKTVLEESFPQQKNGQMDDAAKKKLLERVAVGYIPPSWPTNGHATPSSSITSTSPSTTSTP